MAEGVSWTVPIVIVVVLAVVAGGIGGYLYYTHRPANASGPVLVQVGDNVTVNYVGLFGSGPQNGKVFDTSLYPVAINDAAYPKSLEYHSRGVASNYTTLAVHVGSNTPQSGYSLGNLSFIQVVTGFWQGLVGMAPNSTRTITVPPSLGYGPTVAACTRTLPLAFTLPVFQTLPGPVFSKDYSGILATTGAYFTDPHFGWSVLIVSANSTEVSIQNLAQVGDTASPSGWPVEVTNVSSVPAGTGTITLENQLTASDGGHLVGNDWAGTGPCSSQTKGKFIVSAVNPANGTFTEDFNSEVQGQTLIFIVTVVNLFVPKATA